MNATFAGCAAIALWAFLALLTRGAAELPPLELTALAFTVSAMLGLSVVAMRGRLGALRQKPLAWVHGVGGLAGYHALYFAALDLAPPAEAGLLNYGWPLLIVLFSAPLLGLKLNRGHALGSLLSAVGCLLLLITRDAAEPRGELAWLGDLFAAGAAVTWALYSVLSRKMEAVATEAVAGFCAASAALAMLAAFAFEHPIWPGGTAWLAILALGAGPMGGAFFLWDVGMKRGDPRVLGTLAYATPVLSTLLLCLGGYAPWSVTLAVAALLVAVGGLIASRATRQAG